jgi:hypothetical protein
MEFHGLIRMRAEQLAADEAHVEILRTVEKRLEMFWDLNPALTFGEVADLYLKAVGAADTRKRSSI